MTSNRKPTVMNVYLLCHTTSHLTQNETVIYLWKTDCHLSSVCGIAAPPPFNTIALFHKNQDLAHEACYGVTSPSS